VPSPRSLTKNHTRTRRVVADRGDSVDIDDMQGFFHHDAKRTLDTEIRRSAKLRTELAHYGMASDFDKSGGGIICESVHFERTTL